MKFIRSFLPAEAIVVVTIVSAAVSCGRGMQTAEKIDITSTPVQVVEKMFVVQTNKGLLQMRMEAPRMERYHNDTLDWEVFPDGFNAYAYAEDGRLETAITADVARHDKPQNGHGPEVWKAYGNVVVRNLINDETMQTDTIYWDRANERIYTDCYVSLVSPQGFMQGYGMESDQRARSSVLFREFNSYGVIGSDSTAVVIDSVNFIGPFPEK